jgi:hypothetical protein
VGTCPYVRKVFFLKEIAKQSLQFGTAVTTATGLRAQPAKIAGYSDVQSDLE